MKWLIKALPSDAGDPYTIVVDRGQHQMNAVLSRVSRYRKVSEDYPDLRMLGFAWDLRGITIYRGLELFTMLSASGLHVITIPLGCDIERLSDTRLIPSVATMQVCHESGSADPKIQFMVSSQWQTTKIRFFTPSISLTLIEAAATGIMQVDADYANQP